MPVSENKNWKSLLLNWLSGAANRQDESQLERLASKDAFLAEALHGYREFPEEGHLEDITKLKARLRGRYAKKERRILPIWRIAAAAALFVGVIGGFWWINQTLNESGSIAESQSFEKQEPTAILESDESVTPFEEKTETKTNETQAFDAVEKPSNPGARVSKISPPPLKPTKKVEKEPAKEIRNDVKSEPDIAMEGHRTNTTKEELEAVEEEKSSEEYADEIALEYQIGTKNEPEKKKSEPFISGNVEGQTEEPRSSLENLLSGTSPALPEPREIEGKVTDDVGEPLIGANVVVPGTQKGTTTDMGGNFKLNISGKDEELEISYTGFEAQRVPVDSQDLYQIALNNSGQVLEEVTVSRYEKAKRKADKSNFSSGQQPYPKGGYDKFLKYLERNQNYPISAAQNRIRGIVILKFKINEDGTLSNIQVVQSLNEACDLEAIRVLKAGPKWRTEGTNEMTWKFDFPYQK